MNRLPAFIATSIALTAMIVLFLIVATFFVSPDKRFSIGEPSRFISGIEMLLLGFGIIYFLRWFLRQLK